MPPDQIRVWDRDHLPHIRIEVHKVDVDYLVERGVSKRKYTEMYEWGHWVSVSS